jgi:uncharacterized protein (DUF342 family)
MFNASLDGSEKGFKTFLQKDKANGRPVYVYIGVVDDEHIRALRREYSRGVRADKMGKLPSGELVERSIATSRAYAARAIRGAGSENFEVGLMTQATADAFAAAIGGGIQLKAGENVCLDGRWNEEVKDLVLRVIPGLAEKINKLEGELRGFDAEEEEEASQSFR